MRVFIYKADELARSKKREHSRVAERYSWEEQYEAAILETDRTQLMSRIISAQATVNSRLREMQADHGGSSQEKQAIINAINGLQILRKAP